jgi:hypothetical protein
MQKTNNLIINKIKNMKNAQSIALIVVLFLMGCNNQTKSKNVIVNDLAIESSKEIATVDTQTSENNSSISNLSSKGLFNNANDISIISSKAATITAIDSIKKFIRTAQIKSKVNSVLQSTIFIEDATIKHGGFVTSSLLQSNTNKVEHFEIAKDSLQENIYFTTINTITCRVPNNMLDTFLKDIAKTFVFIDYRNIKADDVTIDFVKNNLVQKRTEAYKKRMNKIADDNAKKPADINIIADGIINKQEEQDNAIIDKLTKLDAIQYSTITIDIYQSEAITEHFIPNVNSNKFKQSFFSSSFSSIKNGWFGLLNFISFLLQLWPLYIISFFVYFIYKKYFKAKHKTK